jgi:urea carboxylase system permease
MTPAEDRTVPLEDADSGYRQTLDRSLGRWATFAAGISFIGVLTGTFQLFGFGLAFGGGAYWWTLPMVAVGQMCVALLFAELASQWPFAGSVYTWSKQLAGATWSWMAGWIYIVAIFVTVAAVALAFQAILPILWSGFQFVGDGTGTYDVQTNAVILGVAGLIFATSFNLLGVKLAGRVNGIGVAIEIGAVIVLVIALALVATRGPGVVTDTLGTGEGHSFGYLGAFLIAALAPAYVLYGFDTASSLGEETNDPHRNAPKSVIQAPLASAILGMLIVLTALMAAPSLTSDEVAAGGLAYIVKDSLGDGLGDVMLACVVVSMSVCLIAIEAAAARMVFAMARDGNLPFSKQLASVNPRTRIPVAATFLVPAVAILVLLINIRQTQIVAVIVSVSVALIYMAYLMITLPMLRARLARRWSVPPGRFSLGRWGLPVNVVAVVWGTAMAINLSWPRAEIFNPTDPQHWYLRYGAWLAIGVTLVGGLAYYYMVQRHRAGVLEEHRASSADASSPAGQDELVLR